MNANWPKEKKEGNRKEKRGEIEKRKKDAVNSPQQNRSETTTAITNKIENYILNYQCCFMYVYLQVARLLSDHSLHWTTKAKVFLRMFLQI